MSYEVLARKWRPKQFTDVVGQDHVTRTLRNAILQGRVGHAYLFVGPRGVGKTSIARIFAKALNCERGPTPEPCDQCDMCREIAAGTSLDVIEIDGASNNSVDQVRDLRESARFVPARGRFKIYIIDEVHMLSIGAFNALLKILEEPPGHVKFFFATTEAHRVPPTIVSRCQRFDLRRIGVRDIVRQLRRIAEAERLEVTDDALWAIARATDGAMRDAESALDQLIAFRGVKIVEEDVLEVFGLVARRHLEELAAAVLRGDVATILSEVDALDRAGKNLARVPLELLEYFRNLLVVATAGDAVEADALPDQLDRLQEWARTVEVPRLLNVMDVLADLEARIRQALSPRTALEIALLQCARASSRVSLEMVLRRLKECLEALGVASGAEAPETPSPPTEAASQAALSEPAESPGSVSGERSRVAEASTETVGEPSPAARTGGVSQDGRALADMWVEVCKLVELVHPVLARALASATPEMSDDGRHLIVRVDESTERRVSGVGSRERILSKAVAQVFGRAVQVKLVAVESSDRAESTELPNASPRSTTGSMHAGSSASATPSLPATSATGNEDARAEAQRKLLEDPRITNFMDIFGGKIVNLE